MTTQPPRRRPGSYGVAILGPSVVTHGSGLEVQLWALETAQAHARPPAGFAALIDAVTVAVEAERRRQSTRSASARRPAITDVEADDAADSFVADPIGTNQAGELLGVAPRTVQRWINEGKLAPARKRAGRHEVSRAAVAAEVTSRRAAG